MNVKTGIFAALLVGLLGVSAARADTCNGVSANLVTNCGFETGTFSGWTGTSTQDTTGNYNGVDSLNPYTGTYEAYLGEKFATTTLSQALATVSGTTYTIKFALDNDTSPSTGYSNSFSALFGSTTLFSESAVAAGSYTLYTYTAVATSASTLLSFTTENDGGFWSLDSVSVAAVPSTSPVPEPGSVVLLGTGLLSLAGAVRRRIRR